jgi:ribosomal protein L19E
MSKKTVTAKKKSNSSSKTQAQSQPSQKKTSRQKAVTKKIPAKKIFIKKSLPKKQYPFTYTELLLNAYREMVSARTIDYQKHHVLYKQNKCLFQIGCAGHEAT